MKSLRTLLFLLILISTSRLYAQQRDVPLTEELFTFIDSYYNNEIVTLEKAKALYNDCVSFMPNYFTEYQKLVHLARCEFYLGMFTMGEYDLDSIQSIKSMTDTSDNHKNLSTQIKERKAKAAAYFDKAIELANQALKLNSSSDAFLIKAMAISSNCTVKNTSYVIYNGLSVSSLAKKAISKNPKNATAYYYQFAQDLYAPSFFANYKRGLKKMMEFHLNSELKKEKYDNYFFITAIAYAYNVLKDTNNSLYWYKKAQEIYPSNNFVNNKIAELSK